MLCSYCTVPQTSFNFTGTFKCLYVGPQMFWCAYVTLILIELYHNCARACAHRYIYTACNSYFS